MTIDSFPLGALETNAYLIVTDAGNAVLIDAPDHADRLLEALKQRNAPLKKILITHGHFDHIGALAALKEQTGAAVYIHEKDAAALSSSRLSLADMFPGFPFSPISPDHLLTDGDIITQDELTFRVMHTPGHSEGSVMYITNDCIFAGDTLFRGSAGRVDLPGSDPQKMQQSLRRIAALTGSYAVYSGHGPSTTLSAEQLTNPYLAVR